MSPHEYRTLSPSQYSEKNEMIQKRNKKRSKRRHNIAKKKGKIIRGLFTIFFCIAMVFAYWAFFRALDFYNFSFESYLGIILSVGGTGLFIGIFLSLNNSIRYKLRRNPEKEPFSKKGFWLRFLVPLILFIVVALLFSERIIPMEYYSFDPLNLSSLKELYSSLVNTF